LEDDTANGMAKHKPHGTIQFAALPWRLSEGGTREIMLLTSRAEDRWIIPKGWPLKGQKPAAVAAQQAYHEAGLIGRVVGKRPIGNFHYSKRFASGEVLRQVRVFLFRVERQLDEWPEKRRRETRWFDAEEAVDLVEEGGLAEIIDNFSGSYARFIAFRKSSDAPRA
jgi:8-oxo-dGTP pyrophosphatase MutT (NUDIX family)